MILHKGRRGRADLAATARPRRFARQAPADGTAWTWHPEKGARVLANRLLSQEPPPLEARTVCQVKLLHADVGHVLGHVARIITHQETIKILGINRVLGKKA